MSKLRTVSGREIKVFWVSLHAYGNPLAFEAQMNNVMEAFDFCKDPPDLQTLTHIVDSKETIYEGYSVQLVPETEPKNAVTDCSWKSSDSKVAKVDQNGIVTAIKAGTTKIMVTTINNKTATATITVKQPSENENVKMAKARINLTRNLINKSRQ